MPARERRAIRRIGQILFASLQFPKGKILSYPFFQRRRALLVVAILLYKLLASSAFAAHASGHTVRASGRSEKPPRSGIFSPHPLRDDAAIPSEFRISRPHTGELQAQLFHEFGLLAIDKTDEHSAIVLRNLLFLLRNGP